MKKEIKKVIKGVLGASTGATAGFKTGLALGPIIAGSASLGTIITALATTAIVPPVAIIGIPAATFFAVWEAVTIGTTIVGAAAGAYVGASDSKQ